MQVHMRTTANMLATEVCMLRYLASFSLYAISVTSRTDMAFVGINQLSDYTVQYHI
ncbi:hypothetical protein DPMN_037041 [Dreissena polymorpha]|uniref:Uncharacterized protein n=1 Tax=Dreissena polymorpha TaxID=45954 RepID=A0A9D4MCM1_DREPO|nr:hypothetical protein DPMN_037041 [Dreissena polymorpha]